MADIIPIHGDRHLKTQKLLPWYVTGQLDAGERGDLEAHLADCVECRAGLLLERQLDAAVANLPIDAERGWQKIRTQINADPAQRHHRTRHRLFGRSLRFGWLVAAPVATVLIGAVMLSLISTPQYRALGSANLRPVGNAVVMFRPDTSEREFRRVLTLSEARLVDGPTAAGAYVLYLPPTKRTSNLKKLSAERAVELAQPIDAGAVR